MEFISHNVEIIVVSIIFFLILLMFSFIIMSIQYTKVRRNYVKMMMGTNRFDFEKVMIQVQEELTELQINQASVSERVDQLQTAIKKLKANIGVYRYNAFAEQQGNDLSFSIAIIDEYQSGLILTGLHSREESYIYAKPLDQGKSRYALSPEEKKAITLAVKTV